MKRILGIFAALLVVIGAGVTFSLRPEQAQAVAGQRYVAMGDSVAAGLGLTGSASDPTCGRSAEAYSTAVAAGQQMSLQAIACSGAKADEGLYGPQTVGGTSLTPQIDTAFAAGVPDLITITIGANDVRWADFVKQCFAIRCGSSFDNLRVRAYLLDLRWELFRTLHTINQRSDYQPPRVVLTGYFDPTEGQTCAALPGVTAKESAWLSAKSAALNDVIADAAAMFDFASFAPADFSGHSSCSADSWIQNAVAPAPFHPTAAGQQAIAQAVITSLANDD